MSLAVSLLRAAAVPPVDFDGVRWTARAVIIRLSAFVAIGGTVGIFWSWLDHGPLADDTAGFFVAIAAAITGTLLLGITVVMPDKARMYALGYRDGMACQSCPLRRTLPEQRRAHLTSV